MKKYIFLGLSLLLFFGCSNDDRSDNQADNMVLVNFSQTTDSGIESNVNDFPFLILTGTVENSSSVTVSISNSGSASGDGVDFSFDSPQIVTIPSGNYDGTVNTSIQIPGLVIIDDTLIEGFETIEFVLSKATGDATLGNQTSLIYTINDDETVSATFSQAIGADEERIGENLPVLLITGNITGNTSVTITDLENGTAILGEDYMINSPVEITIPEGDYDGTLSSAIAIPGLVIIDDNLVENTENFELELSKPTNGILLGNQLTTTYEIEGIDPCENGMADEFPCDGYDLLGRITLTELSAASANDVWGWTDTTTEKEYALIGLDNGTGFVDISGDEPIYLGKLPTTSISSPWRDVKVYNDHAFIVSESAGHGMQVFDLTKLRAVTNAPAVFETDAVYTGFGNAHNIVINEETGFAYVVGTSRSDAFGGGAHFINIQDPKNPIAAGGYAENGYSHDAQVVTYNGPDEDYAGREIYVGANEDVVIIADVTDKDNPTFISSISYASISYTHQGWFTEDQQYFILGDELDEVDSGFKSRTLIFDFTDLDNPVEHHTYLGETSAIDHNGYVKGDEFFLANYTAGVRILDISGIANKSFSEIGFFDTYPSTDNAQFAGVWSVYPYFESGNIIVSDISSGLFIIKKSN